MALGRSGWVLVLLATIGLCGWLSAAEPETPPPKPDTATPAPARASASRRHQRQPLRQHQHPLKHHR